MIGGLVYGYVVFMILPVYASLERMDISLIEAGKDLYHGAVAHLLHRDAAGHPCRAVRRHAAGFLPALGDFVSAQLLGGPNTYMIGNLIQQQFLGGPELAARLGDDRRHDGRADRADGDLPAAPLATRPKPDGLVSRRLRAGRAPRSR